MSPETADPQQPEPERRVATQLLRRLMELAPDAIIVLDSGQRVLFASEQTGRVFGYQRSLCTGCVGRPW